jgi:hypothetical protein
MAATRGRHIRDRCHWHRVGHQFMRQPDRTAGVKTRGSATHVPLAGQPITRVTLNHREEG